MSQSTFLLSSLHTHADNSREYFWIINQKQIIMATIQKITPCLWFDSEAEEAAKYYVSIFKNSRIGRVSHYGSEGQEIHGQKPGTVLTVEFFLGDQRMLAMNGGPVFKFNEAISLIIDCDTQEEIDYYWNKLSEGGDPAAQQCGWLKDKFGLSWQVAPSNVGDMIADPDVKKTDRVMKALMPMKKLDKKALEDAFNG
jgi:predicted 3-demethylubiquinone-9 3-methyltransferase (glyoxalase superfamily)